MQSYPHPPYHPHDHQQCIDQALGQALDLCRTRGVRLTRIRQRVLELVWQSHRPRGAYDLLQELGKEGHNSAPPTVYRALDFLLEQGLVHRIASLNAFIGCNQPGEHHRSGFLICRQCGLTLEMDAQQLAGHVQQEADHHQFRVNHLLIEVSGLCPGCQTRSGNAPSSKHADQTTPGD